MTDEKMLQYLNDGKIEELKSLLEDEVYSEGLGKNAKKRYEYIQRFIKYSKHDGFVNGMGKGAAKPSKISYKGYDYTSFLQGCAVTMTKDKLPSTMEMYEAGKDGLEYPSVTAFLEDAMTSRTNGWLDVANLISEAKKQGYSFNYKECPKSSKFLVKIGAEYLNLNLLDLMYGMIDDGSRAKVYYSTDNKNKTMCFCSGIGYACICPVYISEEVNEKDKNKHVYMTLEQDEQSGELVIR